MTLQCVSGHHSDALMGLRGGGRERLQYLDEKAAVVELTAHHIYAALPQLQPKLLGRLAHHVHSIPQACTADLLLFLFQASHTEKKQPTRVKCINQHPMLGTQTAAGKLLA